MNRTSIPSFDIITRVVQRVFTVHFNQEDWKSTCTCAHYFQEFLCYHIVVLAVINKKTEIPLKHKDVKVGQKPARGRPSAVKPNTALLK